MRPLGEAPDERAAPLACPPTSPLTLPLSPAGLEVQQAPERPAAAPASSSYAVLYGQHGGHMARQQGLGGGGSSSSSSSSSALLDR